MGDKKKRWKGEEGIKMEERGSGQGRQMMEEGWEEEDRVKKREESRGSIWKKKEQSTKHRFTAI